ncbi:RNA methyltransferase [Arcanobacterium phocisimile]|uniref:RNA methyltransferase n=1 Tax=Arcanobacterium phocisimile TaxID=1302235 RepID=A0ABX7IE56_9ACTO|nr:RNA methyltransferase [Arcanobacterium phocisimile]QRV01423.1 RNA methyltransferase [Arcanobacterium phocisimile]
MIIELDSLDDSRLVDYTSLTDVALRKSLEAERGLYMAEGDKVIARAVNAGHTPRSFIMSKRWLEPLQPIIEQATGNSDGGDVPVYVASEELIEELTGFHVHRGALAAMNRPHLPELESFIGSHSSARRIVVLENLVNHTNVGAVFRSMAALGFDAVLLTDSASDPLYRRAVRVSMGTVFQVPWTRIENWPRSMQVLKDNGWITASLALRNDALTLDEFAQLPEVNAPDSKVALILGTEGDGLSNATIAHSDHAVVIPMAGEVDSLNVAAAGAVAAWELRLR